MKKGRSPDEILYNRSVLRDVTNHPRKRAFPSLMGEFLCGNAEAGVEGSKSEILICGGIQSLISKKGKNFCPPENYEGVVNRKGQGLTFLNSERARESGIPGFRGHGSRENARHKGLAFLDAERPRESVIPGFGGHDARVNARPDVHHFDKETKDLLILQRISGDAAGHTTRESVQVQCSKQEDTPPESEEESLDETGTDSSDIARHAIQLEKRHVMSSTWNDKNLDFVVLKQNEVDRGDISTQELFDKPLSLGCSRSSSLEMAGIEGLSAGVSNNVEGNIGSCRACSCSFCLKAAYMWTDLHYQDTKGRLAALKKSRRYARSFEEKLCSHDLTANIARDNSKKSTELEFDLMQRCRSLFLHTEDAFVRETAKLHLDLLKLKDMRENWKKDLEMNSTVSSEKS